MSNAPHTTTDAGMLDTIAGGIEILAGVLTLAYFGTDAIANGFAAMWDYLVVQVETIVYAFGGTVPNGCWVEGGTGEPMAGDMSTMPFGSRVVDCDDLPAWYLDAE